MPESSEAANLSDPAHVTFDVGLEVIHERFQGLEPLIAKAEAESGVQDFADFLA
ncbi:MAG: hypothetical protein OXN96_09765 [Bryobacterales bacterium]|nr:hypothetical protein [Bryobacterales bacterium]MDE0620186.1 hypothetical protein [Bryobacterales bacterium]